MIAIFHIWLIPPYTWASSAKVMGGIISGAYIDTPLSNEPHSDSLLCLDEWLEFGYQLVLRLITTGTFHHLTVDEEHQRGNTHDIILD